MQRIIFIQRNFRVDKNKSYETGKYIYNTIPEPLKEYEDRINDFLSDNWRVFNVVQEKVNNTYILITILIKEE